MRKRQKPNNLAARCAGSLLVIILITGLLPSGVYALSEEDSPDHITSEEIASTEPEDPIITEDPSDMSEGPLTPPSGDLLPGGDIAAPDESIGQVEDADIDTLQTAEILASEDGITEVFDLSESQNIDKASSDGYVIAGVGARTYSGMEAILNGRPLTDSVYTDGRLDFYPNASGKTFKITQSGVRVENSKETKNGTVIIPVITVTQGTKDITLILEDIDLGQYAINNSLYGFISLGNNTSVTILLGTDSSHPAIGSSYVRGSIRVVTGATLIIDSASSPGSSSGALTVSPYHVDASAIGGNSSPSFSNSGNIIINGSTVYAIQNNGASTGAAIGGGGVTAPNTTTQHAGNGNVTINGGTVYAVSAGRGAAIGGGGINAYNAYAGDGNVNITGGNVHAVNTGFGASIGSGSTLYSDNISAGNMAHGGNYSITITGGNVTATADKGAAIGSGLVGRAGLDGSSRAINIGSGAVIKAYASGVDPTSGSLTANARPAIDAGVLTGDGYFVNARLSQLTPNNASAALQIRPDGGGSVIDTLELPKGYRCFAYSTGAARTDNIFAYDASSAAFLGGVTRVYDAGPEIFSISAIGGYNAYAPPKPALLAVTLDEDHVVKETVLTTVTVSKTVKGKYADQTKAFPFTVYLYSDEYGNTPLPSDSEYSFSLSHGQEITLQDIPENVYIRVVEELPGHYTPSFKDSSDIDVTEGNDTGVRLVGAQPRSFDFVNTLMYVPPTGVGDSAVDHMPPLLFSAAILSLSIAAFRRPERILFLLRQLKLCLR